MSIKSMLSFLESPYIEHKVGGKEVRFYALSVKKLFELRRIAKPLSAALAALANKQESDNGTVHRVFTDSETGSGGTVTEIQAIDAELARVRTEERTQAIQQLIESLTGEQNSTLLAELIVDSCRDEFPRNEIKKADYAEFMEHIDAGSMVEFLEGVFLANKKAFGPLGERVAEFLKRGDDTESPLTAMMDGSD